VGQSNGWSLAQGISLNVTVLRAAGGKRPAANAIIGFAPFRHYYGAARKFE